MAALRLTAALGLAVRIEGDEVRVGFDGSDWFGPGRFTIGGHDEALAPMHVTDTSVTVASGDVLASVQMLSDSPVVVFRLEAATALAGIASETFARPSYAWPSFEPGARAAGGLPEGSRGFGFQYTEFALPTQSDASLSHWRLLPFRPQVVEPLGIVAPNGQCLLLAPLNAFHDQVIGVGDDRIACGWHGDLEQVPAGFATEMAIIAGTGPRDCLDRYGVLVRHLNGTQRPARDADELGRRLSYWTDNGSAYWYRTEPGLDTTATLRSTMDDLRDRDIPVGAVQLDSWWYPHEVVRPFNTDDWVVPPTGLVRWEPREDVVPEGIQNLRAALGHPALVTHCRHLSSSSPYVDEHACWIDGDRAHPETSDLYERWLEQAQAWGVATIEHDWLVESFLGVRGLRSEPGRARVWQEGVDRAAAQRGITLQWCMATPADFLQTATLATLTSIRTCGDHGYMIGPGELWTWFLLTNALARALGLRPYKDVFLSDRANPDHHSDGEALLAALSTGPVDIGDALGRADREIVLRTCRDDGVLVRPDVPLAAVDRCFAEHPVARAAPLVAEAWTDHAAGRWVYACAFNVSRFEQRLEEAVELATLGAAAPTGPVACWDWKAGGATRLEPSASWPIALDPLEWDLRVLAPILPSELTVIGDPTRYATAGDTRLAAVEATDDGVRFTVLGANELVTVVGWASSPPHAAKRWTPSSGWGDIDLTYDAEVWRVHVPVPATGWALVEVSANGA